MGVATPRIFNRYGRGGEAANAPRGGFSGRGGVRPQDYRARRSGRRQSRSSRFASAYQKAYDEAKAANETRYQEILSGFRQRRTRALSFLEGAGKQESADITKQFSDLQASGQQDLVSRGLTGTGVLSSQRRGIAGKRVEALGRLNERLQQQRLDVDTRLSGDTLGFQERREDEYPDYQQMQQLAYMQGQGQGGRAGRFAGGGGRFRRNRYFPGIGREQAPRYNPNTYDPFAGRRSQSKGAPQGARAPWMQQMKVAPRAKRYSGRPRAMLSGAWA